MPVKDSSFRTKVLGSRPRQLILAAFLACGLLLSLTASASAVTYTNPTPITIPSVGNASPYPSSNVVAGVPAGDITTSVKVTLNNFSHTFPGDVAIVLVPPAGQGTNVLLMDGAGTNAGGPTTNANITFDGSAANFLPATGPIATGSYKPTKRTASATAPNFPAPGPGINYCNPGPAAGGTPCTIPAGGDALAGALNGFNPNGTWNLFVIDQFSGDAGSIAGGWTLDITTAAGTQRTLSVTKTGSGTGTLTSAPAGIDCGRDCTQAYGADTMVVLTAAPAANTQNPVWTGCDSMTATTCTVNVNGVKNVTAQFDLNPPQTLTVNKTGTGAAAGVVTGSPAGINCGATCAFGYPGGQTVVLTANPPVGTVFTGFTGCDSSTATTCTVTMALAMGRAVTANFTTVPIRNLTVTKSGTGNGNVAGTGISCGADCTEAYNDGTNVVLSATPVAPGSRFSSWVGCDAPSASTCTMNMTSDKTVTAIFTQGPDPAAGGASSPPAIPGAVADVTAPSLTGAGFTASKFRVAGEATPTTGFASRTKAGTTLKYTLSEKATVRIAISQRLSGRRKGTKCVAPTRRLRNAKKCTRIVAKGTLTRISDQGANSVFFTGRIGSRALSPGSYQAAVTATDGAKNVSKVTSLSFRIVRR